MTHLHRRSFLKHSACAVAAFAPALEATLAAEDPAQQHGKVIDCHAHLQHHSRPRWKAMDEKLLAVAAKLGIDQLCCSILTPRRPATLAGFRECNAWAAEAAKRYPGQVLAYCYVNPGYGTKALDEIRRCVEERGFIGIKLYNEYRCTDPVVYPVAELAVELKVPILHHAGHMHYFEKTQPHISDGGHLAELSLRYPEAKLICAHACGGGDWEWTIKALKRAPGVYLDTSGSVTDQGVVELAATTLGASRLLFGCDMSMTAGVGRIRAAALSGTEKACIFGRNMQQILSIRKS